MVNFPLVENRSLVTFGELPMLLPPGSRVPILPNGIDGRLVQSGQGLLSVSGNVNRFYDGRFYIMGYNRYWRFYWIWDRVNEAAQVATWSDGPHSYQTMPEQLVARIRRYRNLLKRHEGFQAVQVGLGATANVYSILNTVYPIRYWWKPLAVGTSPVPSAIPSIITFDVEWSAGFMYSAGQASSAAQQPLSSLAGHDLPPATVHGTATRGPDPGPRAYDKDDQPTLYKETYTIQSGQAQPSPPEHISWRQVTMRGSGGYGQSSDYGDIYLITNPGGRDVDGRGSGDGHDSSACGEGFVWQ